MQLEKLQLTFSAIANADHGIVAEKDIIYRYDRDNHTYTDEKTGMRVAVVLPMQKFEKITVQLPVDGADDAIVPNTKVRFDGFQAHFVKNFSTGEYSLVCRADRAVLVK